eukprot:scaffold2859_cov349-Pavlova_lutheri.AAC.89
MATPARLHRTGGTTRRGSPLAVRSILCGGWHDPPASDPSTVVFPLDWGRAFASEANPWHMDEIRVGSIRTTRIGIGMVSTGVGHRNGPWHERGFDGKRWRRHLTEDVESTRSKGP